MCVIEGGKDIAFDAVAGLATSESSISFFKLSGGICLEIRGDQRAQGRRARELRDHDGRNEENIPVTVNRNRINMLRPHTIRCMVLVWPLATS